MALRELSLNIDKDSNRLVEGFESNVQSFLPGLVLGDTIPVRARFLTSASQTNDRLWDEVDVADYTVRIAIGTPAARPVGGVFTITYGGDTTSELAYNADAGTVETALNALASITSAGGVGVTKSANGAYRISFDDVGVRTDFTTDNSNLYPSTETYAGVAAEGTVSVRHIAIVKLETQPACYAELTTAFPVAAATVTTIRAGATGIGEIRSITLSPEPYDGSFSIEVDGEETGAIAHDAETSTIQTAVEALSTVGSGNITVTGAFPAYTLSFAASLEALTTCTVDVSGLIVPTGKSGELSLNQAGLIELLDGATSVSATLEVELYDPINFTSFTVLQKQVTILDDVIGNQPSAETGGPEYITAAGLKAAFLTAFGITSYADLATANAAEDIGVLYYDEALETIAITTA